ncbi:MAG: UDP-glucose 4-epimerase GalE [Halobacteriovorax sp.]|nr:UDP-glucose 4-epimerase GalE [Halobacteriovorax sp.]|tara:strand:- start:33447 stop:34418 length:972 start_codon:yes stop_codon:yes gene_type:complete
MKILITGGAGYIGSHVLNLLGMAGHDIVVVDNLSTGRKEAMLYGKHVEENLENTEVIDKLFADEKFEACIHFAGSIVVPESVSDPIKYYKNNTENSLNVVGLCVKHGVKNFIFSSTAAVYGDLEGGVCTEESATVPINPYGTSKLMTELMLRDTSAAHDFNFVALRYFNVAGANVDLKVGQCTPNATHLIKIASECASGKRDKMAIFGTDYGTPDGTCIRDYIHVDDLAQAHVDSLTYLAGGGKSEIMNCGYGHGFSVREVIDTVKKVTGVDFPAEEIERRPGDAEKLISVADKIRKTIGWTPKYDDLELIVKTAYEWEKKLQ